MGRYVIAILAALAAVLAGAAAAPAAQYRSEPIISINYGASLDDVHGTAPGGRGASPYSPNAAPAFCVSSGAILILDAANGRIKRFSTEGNALSQTSFRDPAARPETLCGIASGGSGEVAVFSRSDVFLVGDGGNISRITMPDNVECSRAFFLADGRIAVYDSAGSALIAGKAVPGPFAAEKTVAPVRSPWPSPSGGVFSIHHISDNVFFVMGPGRNSPPAARLVPRPGEDLSRPRVIGVDRSGNAHVSWFTSAYEIFSAVSPSGKVVREFVMEPAFASGRAIMADDECVDENGNIYVAFSEKNRFVVKKISPAE